MLVGTAGICIPQCDGAWKECELVAQALVGTNYTYVYMLCILARKFLEHQYKGNNHWEYQYK